MESAETADGLMTPAVVRRLRKIADAQAHRFAFEGWSALFAALQRELDDAFFAKAQYHLEHLRFRHGVLVSARLGQGNTGADYILRGLPQRRGSWFELLWDALDRLLGWRRDHAGAPTISLRPRQSPVYSFSLHPRDEAGARALAELRNRQIALIANALRELAEHLRDFFSMLRAELAFYVGCLNLHKELARKRLKPTLRPTHDPRCVFCTMAPDRVSAENALSFAARGTSPATELHALILPRRHVASYFDLTDPERSAIHELLALVRRDILATDLDVGGFNVGVNVGEIAGQTIFHCHVHLIPRRLGDVANPRGGVRAVIPGKQRINGKQP